jgi:hypothetical protein
LGEAGGLVGGGFEVPVAEPSASSFDEEGSFAVGGDFADGLSGFGVAGDGAEGHFDDDVLAVGAGAAVFAAVAAVAGEDVALVFEVDEGPVVAVAADDDVAAASAVAAVGAAFHGAFVAVEVGGAARRRRFGRMF